MDIQTRKISFIQEFLRLQNEDVIKKLEIMLKKWKIESIEKKITPMSLEQLNLEINQALEDSINNRGIEAKNLKLKYQ